MAPKPTREAEIKARVIPQLKADVQALALLRTEEANESAILREALNLYMRQPEVQERLPEARRRLAEKLAAEAAARGESREAAGDMDQAGRESPSS